MAVVQISRIQVRRGKKNQGTGMPQLASGELAWAVDTQELYIGNGAISEGAPSVGNTKILTNKDSLLEIAAQYQYKYDAQLMSSPVLGTILRNLQSRLDDGSVNARNFGILPSSELLPEEIDQTDRIQAAIDSVSSTTKVTIEFDPGEYEFSETIFLPSNTSIAGFGKELTVFKFTGTGIAFETVDMSENQRLNNFSVKVVDDSTCIKVNRAINQTYKNLKLESTSKLNDSTGLSLRGNGSVIPDNLFSEIYYTNLSYGIQVENVSNAASYNTFDKSTFYSLKKGIFLRGSSNYNSITGCLFDTIDEEGILVEGAGTGNASRENKFKGVGSTVFSKIKFTEQGNTSLNDIFVEQRGQEVDAFGISEVDLLGSALLKIDNTRKISLLAGGEDIFAFKLPLNSATGIKIEYMFVNGTNQVRRGTLGLAVNRVNNSVHIADEYDYDGPAANETSLIFFASIDLSKNAVIIRYNNFNSGTNIFSYTYSILS